MAARMTDLFKKYDDIANGVEDGVSIPLFLEMKTRVVKNTEEIFVCEFLSLVVKTFKYSVGGNLTGDLERYFKQKMTDPAVHFEIRKEGMEISYTIANDTHTPICTTYKFFNEEDFSSVERTIRGL